MKLINVLSCKAAIAGSKTIKRQARDYGPPPCKESNSPGYNLGTHLDFPSPLSFFLKHGTCHQDVGCLGYFRIFSFFLNFWVPNLSCSGPAYPCAAGNPFRGGIISHSIIAHQWNTMFSIQQKDLCGTQEAPDVSGVSSSIPNFIKILHFFILKVFLDNKTLP